MARSNTGRSPHGKGVTLHFIFAVLVAALGSGFQYGYNISVLNAPHQEISNWIVKTSFEGYQPEDVQGQITLIYSIAGSIFCIGGLVGSLATSTTLKYVGLKKGIMASNIFAFLAVFFLVLMRWMESYIFLIISRFVIGLNAGLSSGLVPMYLTAISPTSIRGAIGSCFQLFATIGVLTGQILGLDMIFGNKDWMHLFTIIATVAIFQTLGLPLCPDSPEYLYSQGKRKDARKALVWLRGTKDVEGELQDIAAKKLSAEAKGKVDIRTLLAKAEYRKPLIISCTLMLAQMFSGINAIMAYSTLIFELAKLESSSEYGTLALGTVNVIMTVVSVFTVDLLGRKVLLVISFTAMSIDIMLFFVSFLLADSGMIWASYTCIFFLAIFVASYACGAGPIPWFIVSELFAQSARATAATLVVAVHWSSFFIVELAFPLLEDLIGPYIFIILFVFMVSSSIYTIVTVPETKGKSIGEITAKFES